MSISKRDMFIGAAAVLPLALIAFQFSRNQAPSSTGRREKRESKVRVRRLSHISQSSVDQDDDDSDYPMAPPTLDRRSSMLALSSARYQRTLALLLAAACKKRYPDLTLYVEHGFGLDLSKLASSFFCVLRTAKGDLYTGDMAQVCSTVEQEMKAMIKSALPIERVVLRTEQVLRRLEESGQLSSAAYLHSRNRVRVRCWQLGEFVTLDMGEVHPGTECAGPFSLELYEQGLVLRTPTPTNNAPTESGPLLGEMHTRSWQDRSVLDVNCLGDLNALTMNGRARDLVFMCEALQDQRISELAAQIYKRRQDVKLVLIAGPSSSGKTTFASKLSTHLAVLGMKPQTIGTDDYYQSHDYPNYPRTPAGALDFESVDALRLDVLNDHLLKLFDGEEVQAPIFDFVTGRPSGSRSRRLPPGGVLIMEGIFCLNSKLTSRVPDERKFRIYIAPMNQTGLNELNFVSNQSTRVIRRIARDYIHRGRSALQTIEKWENVRVGEELNIFPFTAQADAFFNSSLEYELPVLKVFVLPLLESVKPETGDYYKQAHRLIRLLEFFHPISEEHVPTTSLLREFIGGSVYEEIVSVASTSNRESSPSGTLVEVKLPVAPVFAEYVPEHVNGVPVIAVMAQGELVSLRKAIRSPKINLVPITVNDPEGKVVYLRSLKFLLAMAAAKEFPKNPLRVEHGFGTEDSELDQARFCVLSGFDKITQEMASTLTNRMKRLVQANLPIEEVTMHVPDAIKALEGCRQSYAVSYLQSRNWTKVVCCQCDEFVCIRQLCLASRTGLLTVFELIPHENGLALVFPSKANPSIPYTFNPNPIVSKTYVDANAWGQLMGTGCVGELNEKVMKGQAKELIQLCEALHDSKLLEVARTIVARRDQVKLVLIAGPSSSGKTTFAAKLSAQLAILGMKPVTVGVDNYYRARADPLHPRTPEGELDFEELGALRLDVLNDHLLRLFRGERVETPVFDFVAGNFSGKPQKKYLPPGGVLVMEGIHCLNDALTSKLPADSKFKIFLSPLCQLNLDELSFFSNQSMRVIRRISRDYIHRGCDALKTIRKWSAVRTGEEKNILPFSRHADVLFDSSLDYELGVLKVFVQPLLETIHSDQKEYDIARSYPTSSCETGNSCGSLITSIQSARNWFPQTQLFASSLAEEVLSNCVPIS